MARSHSLAALLLLGCLTMAHIAEATRQVDPNVANQKEREAAQLAAQVEAQVRPALRGKGQQAVQGGMCRLLACSWRRFRQQASALPKQRHRRPRAGRSCFPPPPV